MMRRGPIGSLLALCLLAVAPATAQTQAQMNAGANAAWQKADAEMTAQWKRTYARMKDRDAGDRSRGGGFGYAAATLASQRAWLQFRDRQCVIEAGRFSGGSMQPLARFQCLQRLTNERTQQLRRLEWNDR